jgi:uncharacterized integral membrane protein
MSTLHMAERTQTHLSLTTIVLRSLVIGLTLVTATIHAQLGGLLFLANAIGYTTFALAMVAPGPIGQVRWLVRLALLGFTAATIGGWLLFGARFPLAYLDKAVEMALISVIAAELWRSDGGAIGVVRQARGLVARLAGHLAGTRPTRAPR